MEDYEGFHGTAQSFAVVILEKGFIVSSTGRRGRGVYLWKQSPYAKDLAVAYYKSSLARGSYSSLANKDCAVLKSKLTISPEEKIDLDSDELKDAIIRLATQNDYDLTDEDKISRLYDFFVEQLEQTWACKYKIALASVDVPRQKFLGYKFPTSAIGQPRCIVVRDVECITDCVAVEV
ncbi:hypothetical protein [Maridesulfovibrio sp.]|uniref:hypothetical protein n=1 Tax=Maridesulfovibrio sp. TaxID=2795000 RepID=UPI0039EFF6E1